MKNKHFLYLIIAALTVASCNKKPSVSFSASNKQPLPEEKVTFNNTSSGAESYVWDFGDGTSSTEQSPIHSFKTEGTYNVKLVAYGKNQKNWNNFTDQVVVTHPTALFTGNLNGSDTRLLQGVQSVTATYGMSQSIASGTRSVVYSATIGTATGKNIKVELGTLSVPSSLNLNQTSPFFHDLIKVQEYYYSSAAANGIRIIYTAPNGIVWATDAGSADQSTSQFIITYTSNSTSGTDRERFKAHFHCTLYDGLGGSMDITDGTFELDFANI
jgi:PKD repeat protein